MYVYTCMYITRYECLYHCGTELIRMCIYIYNSYLAIIVYIGEQTESITLY